MKKKALGAALLSFLLIFSMIFGLLPGNVRAEVVPDPEDISYDADGNLNIANQKDLQTEIEKARSLGVKVNVSENKNPALYVGDTAALNAAITTIENQNQAAITNLKAAVEQQKVNNDAYKEQLVQSFKDANGQTWSYDDLRRLVLSPSELDAYKSDPTVLLAKVIQRFSESSVVTANKNTKRGETHLAEKDFLTTGDTIRYNNVFTDRRSGKIVDLLITIGNIEEIQGIKENATRVPVTKTTLIGGLPDQPRFFYGRHDVTMDVKFLENGTDNPISIIPILLFVDVDHYQGVKVTNAAIIGALPGKNVASDPNRPGVYAATVNTDDRPDGGSNVYWLMFGAQETTGFTYTFYAHTVDELNVYQGIGAMDSVMKDGYTPPTKPQQEVVTVNVLKQPIYHQVSYQFVGNYPKKAKLPTDATKYAVGQKLNVAADPDKISGWTFLGWFEDQTLKTPIKAHPVNTDEIIYGAWKRKPTPPTISSSMSSSLPPSSDSMSTVPGIPQTPEQPPETSSTPKPTKTNAKAPRTGELENRMWGITLLGLATAAVGFATIERKKSKR